MVLKASKKNSKYFLFLWIPATWIFWTFPFSINMCSMGLLRFSRKQDILCHIWVLDFSTFPPFQEFLIPGNVCSIWVLSSRKAHLDLSPTFTCLLICLVIFHHLLRYLFPFACFFFRYFIIITFSILIFLYLLDNFSLSHFTIRCS